MRISDSELKKVLGGHTVTPTGVDYSVTSSIGSELDEESRQREEALVEDVTAKVMNMPDREEMIANLKSRIEAGTYNPSAEEIVDGMVRRTIADRMK